ncbi:ATPase [Alteromonas sp. 1_MG-2023]|uniref:BadF/BadG/BcrA/BcrD ATPase family protein n=1 Tax=Alteromonas sp. 1_MG-2023 TaxID=3062669 RepID=UPI0026E13AB8|nr:BadF/BadG/BcrA/BcrD ATPase family protein [Alteromonas sp. 1_MG-2023]MDO6565543.1 ATPase [Alteromonas sp. 1_MG-2023]
MVNQGYFIGVDGGGTHCRVQLEDEQGNVLSTAEAGSANIMTNAALAMQSIITASEKAISVLNEPVSVLKEHVGEVNKSISELHKPISLANQTIELSQIHLAAGLAGANIPSALEQFLALNHPFKSLTVISDLHAACLGAHNGLSGGLIICGTGSAATVFQQPGKHPSDQDAGFHDKGGYGLSIGDNASGSWLGLEAVKHCLLVFDNLVPQGHLFSMVCESLAVSTAHELVTKVAGFTGKEYGTLAPCVVAAHKKGCTVANSFIQQGASYLTGIAKTLSGNQDFPICLMGGLSYVYQPLLDADIQARLTAPLSTPQAGAIQFAKRKVAKA